MPGQCLSGKYLDKCGACQGFRRGEGGELHLKGRDTPGYFVSRIYDSGGRGTQWNRLVLDIGRDAVPRVHVWLFDERAAGEAVDARESVKEQYDWLSTHAQYHSDYREMPLYGRKDGRGRFARLALEVYPGDGGGDGVFKSFAMSFPKESFTGYLPELYRDNGQLERFLAVQQSIYLEVEAAVDTLGEQMDPVNCSKAQAVRLARWMGWGGLADRVDMYTLRRLLESGPSLINRKGTCGYYIRLTEILTGRKAYIVEEPGLCRATVFIREKPEPGKEKHLDWLRRNVPLGADVRFVVLGRTNRLDGLFFLDVTAALWEYESELSAGGVNIDGIVLL